MKIIEPINQTKLFGLEKYLLELIKLNNTEILPNKVLLTGQKGLGKSTLAYHLINYELSKNENYSYNLDNFEINLDNHSFKTINNKSNPNFILIDIKTDKKNIEINQIRELILNLNKSSFNNKKRFVLIDNIEYLNESSVNSLLKILEEPSFNVFFILINNNKKILPTLLSRCINFKISLKSNDNLDIADNLLGNELYQLVNKDIINYYSTPGNIYNLVRFAELNNINLSKLSLKEFLLTIINEKHYKKNNNINHLIYECIEFYFNNIMSSTSPSIYKKYSYFLKKISDTKKFNLDIETLFLELEDEILNG